MVTKKLPLTKRGDEYTVVLTNGSKIHAKDFKELKSNIGSMLSWEFNARRIISIKETNDHIVVKYQTWDTE